MSRIVVADDDGLLLHTMIDVLATYYPTATIFPAGTGTSLVERVRESSPDVVLTDNMMPGLTGTEATREIRAFDQTVPIYVVTGDIDIPKAVSDIVAAGANGYFGKPFRIQKLLPYLRQHLGKPAIEPELSILHGDDDEDIQLFVQIHITKRLPNATLTQYSNVPS